MVAAEGGWEAFWDAAAQDVCDDGPARRRRRAAAADGVGDASSVPARKRRAREELERMPLNPEEPRGSLDRWRWNPAQSPWWKLLNGTAGEVD